MLTDVKVFDFTEGMKLVKNIKNKSTEKNTARTFDSETRYILFNSRHRAVRLGKEGELENLQIEARSLHEISGGSYRIYDKEAKGDVYHWPPKEQQCRICGCTWDNACKGGCYWVEEDLCSQCVGQAGPEIREVG